MSSLAATKILLQDEGVDALGQNDHLWQLPRVKGRYLFDYKLSKMTWFKVGGVAQVLFKPHDIEDLQNFLMDKDKTMPTLMLGAGSNVLIRDGGFKGCVIKLPSTFASIEFDKALSQVVVGAACLDRTLVMECANEGFSGLEFLVGVPGTIGGAIAMNAGAYGGEVKDSLVWVEVLLPDATLVRLLSDQLMMTYRKGNLLKDAIVVKACFQLKIAEPFDIFETIDAHLQKREDTQPIRGRTGGSTFKNPKDSPLSAWQLIDQAGCRGLTLNDAMVSDKHCNFLLNLDAATAADLETLGNEVKAKVKAQSGVDLEWEIIRIGEV